MIGNSLRSDIQPALAAGINAVYIPNPHTWHMEHVEFAHDASGQGTYLELTSFTELTSVFASTGE
jgi:putative hydrolase of the HAD superfamily